MEGALDVAQVRSDRDCDIREIEARCDAQASLRGIALRFTCIV